MKAGSAGCRGVAGADADAAGAAGVDVDGGVGTDVDGGAFRLAQPLSASDRAIADQLAPLLHARGILLAGIDVIGNRLTEINVTSPTCFVEITQQTGFSVAGMFLDAMERACAA